MAKYPDQTRNLNPTPEAVAAMWLFGREYAESMGGSMDFWDRLDASRKRQCRDLVTDIGKAAQRHNRPLKGE